MTTKYLVDTNNLTGYAQVVEEIQGGNVVKAYTFGHDLISQRTVGGNVSFYGYDGHGSVRQLTDNLGNVTDRYDYDAFGTLINQTGTTDNNYLYAGEQFDADLGFYYNRARYLNVQTGRFVSMDDYEGDAFDPPSLHKYTYTNANPVNYTDPSGRFLVMELGALGARMTLQNMAVMSFAIVCSFQLSMTTTFSMAGGDTSNIPGLCVNRTREQPNQMRLQLQQGFNHIDQEVMQAPPARGVTVIQFEVGLRTLFHKSKHKIPGRLESKYLGAIARTGIWARTLPPFGVPYQGGRNNVWREEFQGYRVDTENIRGNNNLSSFF